MELEIKQLIGLLIRRLWMIIGTVVIFCAGTFAYDQLYSQPVYEAVSKVIVNSSQVANLSTKLDINEINSNIMVIDTYKEIIVTPAIMDKVVAQSPELELDTYELISQVKVETSDKSQIMSISIQNVSPTIAASIVNTVAEVFKEEIPNIMSVDNVTILSRADAEHSSVPVSPGLIFKLAVAFVLAFLFSIGAILLREYFDDTLRTEEDIANDLGKPVLCTIAAIRKRDMKTSSIKVQSGRVGESVQVSANR